jgi:hypothetical protein
VFLLGFYTLSAKPTIRRKLALHQRSALWQHVESDCATGANNHSTFFILRDFTETAPN